MITCGIDIGSRTSKLVLYDSLKDSELVTLIEDSAYNHRKAAVSLLGKAVDAAGIDRAEIAKTIATGYGRNLVEFADDTVTEITCHAKGVLRVLADAKSIIDIGGQDSKAIFLDDGGLVKDFMINDRCAAGTGRFLEAVARIFEVGIDEMGKLSENPERIVDISSMCVVFAESEIIGLISEGIPRSSIINAVERSITRRVLSMSSSAKLRSRIVFTGGVALNSGMVRTLSQELGRDIAVPPVPQITGALGAALIAAEKS